MKSYVCGAPNIDTQKSPAVVAGQDIQLADHVSIHSPSPLISKNDWSAFDSCPANAPPKKIMNLLQVSCHFEVIFYFFVTNCVYITFQCVLET
jgi:hypothetical protein